MMTMIETVLTGRLSGVANSLGTIATIRRSDQLLSLVQYSLFQAPGLPKHGSVSMAG